MCIISEMFINTHVKFIDVYVLSNLPILFTQKGDMKTNVRTAHFNIKEFKCDNCGKVRTENHFISIHVA